MFISRKEYDKLNARNVELAREIRHLNLKNKGLCEENKDLYSANKNLYDLLEVYKRIYLLATSNTYNNDKAVLGKIKEVIQSANINNF